MQSFCAVFTLIMWKSLLNSGNNSLICICWMLTYLLVPSGFRLHCYRFVVDFVIHYIFLLYRCKSLNTLWLNDWKVKMYQIAIEFGSCVFKRCIIAHLNRVLMVYIILRNLIEFNNCFHYRHLFRLFYRNGWLIPEISTMMVIGNRFI